MASDNATILGLVRTLSLRDPAMAPAIVDDGVVTSFINLMRPYVSCDMGDMGLALSVLNEMTLSFRDSTDPVPAGPLTEEREGQLQRAYAAPQGVPAYWALTPYGMRFWAWAQRTIFAAGNRLTMGCGNPLLTIPRGWDDL